MNLASSKRQWPLGRGFERFYGFLGGETNQWYPDLVHDNHPVRAPTTPEDGLPPHRGPHRQGDRVHPGREGGRAGQAVLPLLLPRRRARAAPRSEGVERQVQGQVRHGLRGVPRDRLRAAEGAAACWPTTPSSRRSTRTSRPPATTASRWPEVDHRAAVGDPRRDDEKGLFPRMAEVYAGFLQPCRPRDRPAARLPRETRPARQHHRRAGVRQRRVRRGRPERVGQREPVLQRHARHHRGEPEVSRRARQPADLQPLPDRLGVGVQHPVQDVEAVRQLRGRHGRSAIVSWPKGITQTGYRRQYNHAIDIVPTMLELPRRRDARRGEGLHAAPRSRA